MHYQIRYQPSHALAVVHLEHGESVRAEASAMVSMTDNIEVRTQGPIQGGVLKSFKRAMLGSETFFTNLFLANDGSGHVTLAPKLCGDLRVHQIGYGEQLFIQGGSYVSAPDSVEIDTRFQGFKGFLSGESLFFLSASGSGPVLLNAFGAIEELDLDGELVVDTGHLVAFTSGLEYRISKAARGWISSYLSGEGFVLRLSGRGKVYLQSRNPSEFGKAVGALLPARQG